jgi:hypothetical protein
MNKVFASKLPNGSTGLSEGGDGQGLSLLALSRAPGTIPATVNPPRGPVTSPDEPLVASMTPAAAPVAPAPATRVASAAPTSQSDGFFSNLARKVGIGGTADTTATAQPIPAKPKAIEAKPAIPKAIAAAAPKATETKATETKAAETKAAEPKAAETKQAAARPPLKPSVSDAPVAATAAPAAKDALVAGSAPIIQSSSFDSRFSAFK